MSHPSGSRRQDDDDWGTKVINELLLPLAKVAPPLILVGLMTVCVIANWDQGWGHVLRQFAGILLPLTVVLVLKLGDPNRSQRWAHKVPSWTSFILMFALSVGTMALLTINTSIFMMQVVMSTALSIILFAKNLKVDELPYCLGLLVGSLGFVIVAGVPGL
jgi:hypothetical protein